MKMTGLLLILDDSSSEVEGKVDDVTYKSLLPLNTRD